MKFVRNDGGRLNAGFKGTTSDCVVRATAIVTGKHYIEVYNAINELSKSERPRKGRPRSNSRTGVYRRTLHKYLIALGYTWHATMRIGSGCKVHLNEKELPPGKLLVVLSRHFTAVIDGVINDNYDPSRHGMRCVYGYYSL